MGCCDGTHSDRRAIRGHRVAVPDCAVRGVSVRRLRHHRQRRYLPVNLHGKRIAMSLPRRFTHFATPPGAGLFIPMTQAPVLASRALGFEESKARGVYASRAAPLALIGAVIPSFTVARLVCRAFFRIRLARLLRDSRLIPLPECKSGKTPPLAVPRLTAGIFIMGRLALSGLDVIINSSARIEGASVPSSFNVCQSARLICRARVKTIQRVSSSAGCGTANLASSSTGGATPPDCAPLSALTCRTDSSFPVRQAFTGAVGFLLFAKTTIHLILCGLIPPTAPLKSL